jgi:4-hydroxybenzoate polyprenyltransferase
LNHTFSANQPTLLHLRLFLALSRMSHVLLDMATPALAVLLCLGGLPSAEIIALGLVTAFAGYTAVYALNDLVDSRVDREKMRFLAADGTAYDLDALYVRHPLARGLLSLKAGLWWVCGWSLVALGGAYLLHPACALIFLISVLLEIAYCLLLKISCLRIIVSGMVKSAGAIAALFAVDPRPDVFFMLLIFGFIFFWEVGGQNIPNDWSDMNSDKLLGAKTVPVLLGLPVTGIVVVTANALAVAFSVMAGWALPALRSSVYIAAVVLTGMAILIIPSIRLYLSREARHASQLFNRASFYPLLLCVLALTCLMLG